MPVAHTAQRWQVWAGSKSSNTTAKPAFKKDQLLFTYLLLDDGYDDSNSD